MQKIISERLVMIILQITMKTIQIRKRKIHETIIDNDGFSKFPIIREFSIDNKGFLDNK